VAAKVKIKAEGEEPRKPARDQCAGDGGLNCVEPVDHMLREIR
jgi:hypothetical protein